MNFTAILPITASAVTFGPLAAPTAAITAGTSAAATTSAAHTILVGWAGAY